MSKKKPSIAFLLSGKDDNDEDDAGDYSDDDSGDTDKLDACSAVLDAIKSGDPQGLCDALDSFLDLR